MRNKEKQEEKIKPRIAILYQGENATDYRKHVVERLKYCNAEPVEVAFNEEGHEDDVRINKRVINDLMRCDAAIALLTKDTRAASACGNLWLEVGLWIGLKSRRTIRIIQEGEPDNWDIHRDGEWPVKLPSNILGEYCPDFKTTDKLTNLVTMFVEKIRGMLRPSFNVDTHTEEGIFIDESKIREIFIRDNVTWDPGELLYCQERDEKYECLCRKEMTGLLCEFLRMGECNFADFLIEICFHRLSHLCKVAVLADYMGTIKDPITRADQRQRAIDEIHKIVNALCVVEKSLRWLTEKQVADNSGWKKLRDHLVYRLNLDYCFKYRKPPDDLTKKTHREETKFFCEWAEELSKGDYKSHSYYDSGFVPFGPTNRASEMAERFQKCHRIAKGISKSLSVLKTGFFAEYSDAIKRGIDTLTDPSKFTNSLKVIRSSLPQNQHESELPRIWPISARDNKLQKVSVGIG